MEEHFDGETFEAPSDGRRLTSQLQRVRLAVLDGHWRTLEEIGRIAQAPAPSVSARLRDLRKPRFGAYLVERRERGPREDGLFEYRVQPRSARP